MNKLEQLPHFTEGERAILGAMLIDNGVISDVMARLSPEEFYHTPHRTAYEAILELYSKDQSVDWGTLAERLVAKGKLESVGGQNFLVSLADAVPSTANTRHYVEFVKEAANRRKLINTFREAISGLYDKDSPIDAAVGGVHSVLLEGVVSPSDDKPVHVREIVTEHVKVLERLSSGQKHPGLSTGFPSIDHCTGGFGPQDLVILCARPSMGKTALGTQILTNVAKNIETGFAILFSLEMGKLAISARLLSERSGVNLKTVRQGPIKSASLSTIMEACADLCEHSLWVDETSNTRPLDVYAKTAQIASHTKLAPALVVVDYLQIMEPDKPNSSREREVATIAKDLKRCAKRLNCPVLLLSQLNRQCEQRPLKDRRPKLSDLRESGAIEQDADIVMGLFRLGYYAERGESGVNDTTATRGHAECITLKNRNGPVGMAKLWWRAETSSFHTRSQLDEHEPPEEGRVRLDLI